MSTRIDTKASAQPVAAYSQAVHAGQLVFVSGQIPIVPQTGNLLSEDMAAATTQCIANAEAILQAAGLGLNNVVKSSVFLTTMDDYAEMDAPTERPCLNLFQPEKRGCSSLAQGARVEISMIASKDY